MRAISAERIIPWYDQAAFLPQPYHGSFVVAVIAVDGKFVVVDPGHVNGFDSAQLDFNEEKLVITGIDDIVLYTGLACI